MLLLRDCERCYCRAAYPDALCQMCACAPRDRPVSVLDLLDDDGTSCVACRSLLCPLHATPEQRARRRCGGCADDASADHDSDLSVYSLEQDEEQEEEEEESEQVTTPLSYRHAFGIEYDSVSADSSDEDVPAEEEARQETETEQLMEMAFVEWLLNADGRSKRRKLSLQSGADRTPYKIVTSTPNTDETCSICLDAFALSPQTVVGMHCHPAHKFHQTCIDQWLLKEAATCPLCQHTFA